MKKLGLIAALLIIIFPSCNKEKYSSIPYAPVYLRIDLSFLDRDLAPMLATKTFTTPRQHSDKLGFGGILVINGYSTDGEINLYAFDLACPVESDEDIVRVIPDEEGNATCPQCKETYIIRSGTGIPTKGSKYALRSYSVRPAGYNKYIISN